MQNPKFSSKSFSVNHNNKKIGKIFLKHFLTINYNFYMKKTFTALLVFTSLTCFAADSTGPSTDTATAAAATKVLKTAEEQKQENGTPTDAQPAAKN